MEIKISCDVKDYLSLKDLIPFQGGLKNITDENITKLKNSIKKHGIITPAFIWNNGVENYVLDAHQRIKALLELQADGFKIPKIPVVFLDIKNEAEAKNILLKISSKYGDFDKDGFDNFIGDIEIDFENINIDLDFEIYDEEKEFEEVEETIKPYNKSHILISFNPDKFIEIIELVNQIKDIEGVEIETASN